MQKHCRSLRGLAVTVAASILGGCAAPGVEWSALPASAPCCDTVAHLPFAALQPDVLTPVSVAVTPVFHFAEGPSTFAALTLPSPSGAGGLRLRIDSFVRPEAPARASAFAPVALWLDEERVPLAAPQPVFYRQAHDLWRGEHLRAVLVVPPAARHVVLFTPASSRGERFALQGAPWITAVPLANGASMLMPTPGRTLDVSRAPVGHLRVLVENRS